MHEAAIAEGLVDGVTERLPGQRIAAVRRVEQAMLAGLDTGEQDQMRHLLSMCIAALTTSPAAGWRRS